MSSLASDRVLVDEKRHGVHQGVGLVTGWSALILATVWFLPTTAKGRVIVLGLTCATLIVALALTKLPWDRLPVRALLVFPLVAVASLTVEGAFSSHIGIAYAGLFTVAILYVASTQSERLTLLSIPPALACWVICQGGFSPTIEVRMSIVAFIWALVGHSLCQRRASNATRIEGLLRAASTDPLTGFASRGELSHVLERVEKGDALVLLDLDGFKTVNDVRGHQAGDLILVEFGQTVRGVVRSSDCALRYGGDEVLLLVPQTGAAGAEALLQRLRQQWAAPDRPAFSAGVATCEGEASLDTLRRADEALYVAKSRGRDRWFHAPRGSHLTVVK